MKNGQIMTLVGIYGGGKKRYVDSLVSTYNETRVVRISFEGEVLPQIEEVYKAFKDAFVEMKEMPKSDFGLHYELKKIGQSPIVLVIEEVQQLLHLPESFFDALANWQYYANGKVTIILSGQPQIRTTTNMGFNRLTRQKLTYVPSLKPRQIGQQLYRLTHGHEGTVKYIRQKMAENQTEKVTMKQLQNWVKADVMFKHFVRIIVSSLTNKEAELLKRLIKTGNLAPKEQSSWQFSELVRLNLLVPTKHGVEFIVPAYVEVVRDMLDEVFGGRGEVEQSWDQLIQELNNQERLVFARLREKNEVVTWEQLGEELWPGDDGTNYSLWSIQKVINRLRKKMLSLGISPRIVKTVRGVGYQWIQSRDDQSRD